MSELITKELTERQKDILKSQNLPQQWDELDMSVQESIEAIEEMLQYLEHKYGKTFVYAGYKKANRTFNDEESLLAYAVGDDPETQKCTVTRTKDGLEDTYGWVLALPSFSKKMQNKVADLLDDKNYKLFIKLLGVSNDGAVKASTVAVVIEADYDQVSKDLFDKVAARLSNEDGVYKILMYCVSPGTTDSMDQQNYEQVMNSDNTLGRYSALSSAN